MLNLRQRSGFSFRHSFGQLDDVMACVESDYAALTDRASTFGHIRWGALCKKHEKKPIFGVELLVVESIGEKKTPSFLATFIATESVEPIYEMFGIATQQFKYEPRLKYDDVNAFISSGKGVVIIGNGARLDRIVRSDRCFVAVGPETTKEYALTALDLGFGVVAVGNNVYPTAFDRGAYEVLCGRNAESQSYPQHIIQESEWRLKWGREIGRASCRERV